jgi:WD40 repeat protein/serine/threonine protein kinase
MTASGDISNSESDVLLELAEEFAERYRRGERPALSEYTQKHPKLADRIRRLFPTLAVMEQFGSVAGEQTFGVVSSGDDGKPWIGRQLGDYTILREIGRGGMGIVYEAVQESLGRHVALKVLPMHGLMSPSHIGRFRREARAAAQLHHTNIVPVFGVGEHEGTHYYAMQFIQGHGLDDVIDEVKRLRRGKSQPATDESSADHSQVARPISAIVARAMTDGTFATEAPPGGKKSVHSDAGSPPVHDFSGKRLATATTNQCETTPEHLPESDLSSEAGQRYFRSVARVGVQVADALAYAHSQEILHRDIKPSNLLLDRQGTVWVTDFGLAKISPLSPSPVGDNENEAEDLTHTGDLVGTLRYMAPERLNGDANWTSDVYSLGITLYEMLTLSAAFQASGRAQLIEQILHNDPPAPRLAERRIPRDLETIVLKAIAKEPERRYRTASALAEDLRRFLSDRPIEARRSSAIERCRRWCRRNPVVAGLIAALAILLVAIGVVFCLKSSVLAISSVAILLVAIGAGGTVAAFQFRRQALQEQKLRREADENLYYQRVASAHGVLMSAIPNPGKAEALLEACPSIHRGWEWHYLKRLWRIEPDILQSESEGFNGVAFSPDGTRLAAACGDGTVRIWDLDPRRRREVILRGHDGMVFSVAFSPTDSSRLASAGHDGTVRVWDLKTEQESLRLAGAVGIYVQGAAYRVTFSPDGRWLAACSEGSTVRIWDSTSGQLIHELPGHEVRASCVAFSPDGKLLATGGWLGIVRIWDALGGQCLHQLREEHSHPVGALAFSTDGRHLVSGYFDRTIDVWDATSGKRLRSLLGHTGIVNGLAFHPEGRRLASSSEDRTVRIWDLFTGRELLELRGHADMCLGLAFNASGRLLASTSVDRTIRLWDATPLTGNEGEEVRTFTEPTREVWCVAISPDGTQVAASGQDPTVCVWDSRTGALYRRFPDFTQVVFQLAFSPDGRYLAAAGIDSGRPAFALKLLDIRTGQIVATVRERNEIFAMAFHPDGQWLAYCLGEGTVKLVEIADSHTITLGKHDVDIVLQGVAFSPDGTRLASASRDGTVKVWDVTAALSGRHQSSGSAAVGRSEEAGSFQPLREFSRPGIAPWSVAYSPDGRHIITGGIDGQLTLWDAETGEQLNKKSEASSGGFLSAAYTPNERWIALASEDCTVRVLEVTTWDLVHTFRGHLGPIRCLAASDEFLVTASADKTVKVWSLKPLEKNGGR